MILVASTAVVGAEARLAAGVEVGLTDGGGGGGGVGEGGGKSAAVVSPSITLIIAASLPPFVPAALPRTVLMPCHGPND